MSLDIVRGASNDSAALAALAVAALHDGNTTGSIGSSSNLTAAAAAVNGSQDPVFNSVPLNGSTAADRDALPAGVTVAIFYGVLVRPPAGRGAAGQCCVHAHPHDKLEDHTAE